MASGEIEITPGRVFAPNELITPPKLNDLGLPVARVKSAAITARELADGSISSDKLDVTLEAQLGVADGSVTTSKIVDKAVTGAKIADDFITAWSALTNLDAGDMLLVWDASASSFKKIDIANILPAGAIIQTQRTVHTTYSTTNSTIPIDDTIPQITEGTQLLTATITPRYNTSLIRCRFSANGTISADFQNGAFALFRDSVVNAIAARSFFCDQQEVFSSYFEIYDAPATTSTISYQIRFGRQSGGSGTFYVNGWTGGRIFGGVAPATLVLEEIKQ
jgi:hypothetical protein